MQTILFSNIGNRNLLLNDHFISENFRETTKDLYDKNDLTGLKLNILNTLLNELKPKPDKIVLFASNQQEGRNNQDTLYAAELVKMLIEQEYKIETQVVLLQVPVFDSNKLLKTYRNNIRRIVPKENKEVSIIVCDTGGTAQQKSSLRTVIQFLFQDDSIKIYTVVQSQTNQSHVQLNNTEEYLKILLTERIETLIEQLKYQEAIILLGKTEQSCLVSKSIAEKLLVVGGKLSAYNYKEVPNLLNNFSQKQLDKLPLLNSYIYQTAYINSDDWEQIWSEASMIQIGENLQKVAFYYQQKNCSSFLLSLTIFYEIYLNLYLADYEGIDLSKAGGDRSKYLNQEAEELKLKYPALAMQYGSDKLRTDVSGLLHIAKANTTHIKHQNFMQLLSAVINDGSQYWNKKNFKGINSMRNSLVHRGTYYTQSTFKKKWPNYKQWTEELFVIFGIDAEQSIYHQLNSEIVKQLR